MARRPASVPECSRLGHQRPKEEREEKGEGRGGAGVERRPASGKLRHAPLPGVSSEGGAQRSRTQRTGGMERAGPCCLSFHPFPLGVPGSRLLRSERTRALSCSRPRESRPNSSAPSRSATETALVLQGDKRTSSPRAVRPAVRSGAELRPPPGGPIHSEGRHRDRCLLRPQDRVGIFSSSPNLCLGATLCPALCWVMLGTQQ